MADVRCPMCGKLNPAEANACRYCQARLKPLAGAGTAGAQSPSQPRPSANPEPSSPGDTGWLRSLLDGSGEGGGAPDNSATPGSDTAPSGPQNAGEEEDNAEWLARIRQRKNEEPDQLSKLGPKPQTPGVEDADWTAGSPLEGGNDLADWLASLREGDEVEPPPAPAPATAQKGSGAKKPPKGSGTLRKPPTPAGGAPSSPARQPEPESDDDEWLRSLTARIQASQSLDEALSSARPIPPALPPASAIDSPGESAQLPSESPSADELPDWINEIPPVGSDLQPSPTTLPGEITGGPVDWMRDLSTAEEEPTLAPSDVPDWMKEVPAPSEEPDQFSAAPAEDLPDWLRELQGESQAEPAAESQMQERLPEEVEPGLPDWQSQVEPPTGTPGISAAQPTDLAQAETPGAEEELPEWLRDFQAGSATPEAPAAAPEAISFLPQELGATTAPADTEVAFTPPIETSEQLPPTAESAAPEEALPAPEGETPEWLKEFESAPIETPAIAGEAAAPPDSVREWLNSLNSAETPTPTPALESVGEEGLVPAEIPDWLQAIREQPPAQPIEPVQPAEPLGTTTSPFGQENLPDWMNAPQPAEASWEEPEAQPAEAAPMASSEMSDLLASVSAEQGASAEAGAEALEPAQLPTWLQAMRPVESAVGDAPAPAAVDDQRVEKSGPLAGLRGVLPGEELVSKYRKPPVYTNKLQVSEKQHLHSSLLEGILGEETQAQPIPPEPTQAPQVITRLVVAVLLVILALIPTLTGFNLTVPPGLLDSQPGLTATFQTINNLPSGANVLLAAEFEAGLSGELKAAALPVLLQLQSRQPKVVIASTVPTGPVLGEALLTQAKGSPLMNLGFLPGGTSSLKMLAAHASAENSFPLRQVAPFPYVRAWNDAAVKGLTDINSFQCIILITDSLENARNWVEQVQPNLGTRTKLILVSSAQVAPLVRTYLQNGQVQGLVSGLVGGTAYEQLTRQPGPATRFWSAYQLTLAAMVLLIIAGALAAGISALFGHGKSKGKA